jgi:Tfp pilus assembly protein PilW
MANPRNVLSFDEVGVQYRSFIIDNSTITFDSTKPYGSAQAGAQLAVSFSAAKTVQLASDGEALVGRLEKVEADLKATVAVKGCLAFKGGQSATLTLGTAIVGALGAASAKGFVRSAASGTAAELIKCRGQIYDAGDTSNVWVEL